MARPRTTSFSEEEMIILGKEMLEWVRSHPKTLHLSEWYSGEKMFLYREWKTFIQRDEFLPYYEQALSIIGRKYLDKTSDVREGISQRWQRAYFKDLKEIEDQDLDDAAIRALKASEADKVDPQLLEQFKTFMNMVKDTQDKPKV